jgi:hypothetical protein
VNKTICLVPHCCIPQSYIQIFFSAACSQTLTIGILRIRKHVSHPHNFSGKIIVA